jgi:hypothetical protein
VVCVVIVAACGFAEPTPSAPSIADPVGPPFPTAGGVCGDDAEVPEAPVYAFFTCRAVPAVGPPIAYPVPRPAQAADPLSRLEASLIALLIGPTSHEQALGYDSFFSAETADALRGVAIAPDGMATVDFHDLRSLMPTVATTAESAALLAQLNATVFQFEEIRAVEYRIDGSCESFWRWLESSCHTVERP